MALDKLQQLLMTGEAHTYPKGQVIYSLDFDEEFYLVKKGYVKRYSMTQINTRSVQSIYGPGYFFPLTPVFTKLLKYNVGQESATYFYETITDVEICGISNSKLASAVEANPELYAAILFESARRIKSNIHQLENNALGSNYKKVGHHLTYLADEFGELEEQKLTTSIRIEVPLTVADVSEQVGVPLDETAAQLKRLETQQIITITGEEFFIQNLDLLKDSYL